MRDLLIGVALAWLTVGSVSSPLPAVGESRDLASGSQATLASGFSSTCGLATLRVGSPSPPDVGTHGFAILVDASLPRPAVAAGTAASVDSSIVALLELTRPQRGPPPST